MLGEIESVQPRKLGYKMLEKIDQTDWSQLSHAYGEASDVPDMIRALAASDPDNRREELDALWSSILHQGSVYTATAAAIPFLIELLEDPNIHGKNDVLDLLQGAAEGWLDLDGDEAEDGDGLPLHIREAHAAVEQASGLYCRLLFDQDPSVRVSAALLVRCLVHRSGEVSLGLMKAIQSDK